MAYDYKGTYSGTIKKTATGESLFFSPKPIPSTSIKKGELGNQPEVLMINDTVMDIGSPQKGAALQARVSAMGTSLMVIVLIFLLFFLSYLTMIRERYNHDFYYYLFEQVREFPNALIFAFSFASFILWGGAN